MADTTSFFDDVAPFYDEMISFDRGVEKRKELLAGLLPAARHNIADIGSGTGLDTIAASLLGHRVTSFDVSAEMLKAAEQNANRFHVEPKIVQAGFRDIPNSYNSSFSVVISTGNTLALIKKDELQNVFDAIYALLQPNGLAFIQLLNFDRVLSAKERIVAITKNEDEHYIRFYDFHTDYIDFNIMRFNCKNPAEQKLLTTHLYPHTVVELQKHVKQTGFSSVQIFGGLAKQPFNPETSKDILLILTK